VKDETLPSSLEHTIDAQRVKVHGQVQRTTKALNHHDRSAPFVAYAGPPRPGAQEAEHGSHVHARHRAAQIVVPRKQVPQAMRQTQYPLSQRNVGQHVVDEMGRPFGHPAPGATGTEPAPLAGERHEAIVTAGVAVEARETRAETPAGEEFAKPLSTNRGRPSPSLSEAACTRNVS